MNPSRDSREWLRFARIGFSDLARQRLHTGVPVGVAVIALAAALAIGGEARAARECGPPQPGVEIQCTPSDYNAAEHGNIFYGAEVPGGDFSIRLADDLAVAYDRDSSDDDLRLGDFDSAGFYRYGAVVVVPGDPAHTGDIAVSSAADVTSTGTNARGYLIGHIGVSGRIRMELEGGAVTTQGDQTVGILGFHGSEGDISAALRGTAIGAEGDDSAGVWLRHTGTGDLVIGAEGGSVDARGARARGIFSDHTGTGNSTVALRDVAVGVEGDAAYGIFDYRAGEGDSALTMREVSVSASGNAAAGVHRTHYGNGDQVIGTEGGRIDAVGGDAHGILSTHWSEGDISAALRGTAIGAEGDDSAGVWLRHTGTGDLVIGAEGGSVDARGARARGIFSDHTGTGNSTVALRDVAVGVEGDAAYGIFDYRAGEGDSALTMREVSVSASGNAAAGVHRTHYGNGDQVIGAEGGRIDAVGGDALGILSAHLGEGRNTVDLRDVAISAEGDGAAAVRLQHAGTGDLVIGAEGGRIDAVGGDALGILSAHLGEGRNTVDLRDVAISAEGDGAVAVRLQHGRTGDIGIVAEGGMAVDLRDVAVAVEGEDAYGVRVAHLGAGDIDVDARGGGIVAEGQGSRGIYARHYGTGDVVVDAEGIDISAMGEIAQGVHADHTGSEGDIAIHLSDATIMVAGDQVDGISATGVRAQHLSANGDIDIHLRGTTVTASGEGALGILALHEAGKGSIRIRVDGGTVHAEDPAGVAVLVGSLDEETGAVEFAAEVGADGYRGQSVMVNGRARGGSGDGAGIRLAGGGRVEIGSRGSVGAASGIAVQAPGDGAALHVSADFDGRRAGDVIDGEILNDGGWTTIAVNGVTLHDGMAGATGLWAPNGARDVTVAAADTIVGQSFSTADFVEPYAPRAAVYEALPGFLLRLDGRGTAVGRLRKPGSPAWVRVFGGEGSYGPDRSSVGASYDFDRFGVEAGLDAALSPAGDVTGSVSLRHARGSAGVSAPTGGGSIEAEGIGAALGATWRDDAGYYVNGRISITGYKTDLRSGGRGRLKEDAESTVRSLGVEAGRRLALGEWMHLTPRAWLTRSDVSLSGFRDTVGSRVSFPAAARTAAGLGIAAETAHSWHGGERTLSVRGELGAERTLGDAETVADVSGERLGSEATRTRAVLGFGGEYRWGRWSLGGEITASGLGSDDSEYAAGLRFGMRF